MTGSASADLTEKQSLRLLAAPLAIETGFTPDEPVVFQERDLGYRLLEGGADNDEVYTFAFFNYAVAGVRVRF